MATATQPVSADPRPVGPPPRPTYTCPQCGHDLSVSGLGRHRIFFAADDGGLTDAVMNGRCPECGLGLPGKNPS
jgi:ssDNA-binding Zn-finger/Zn-ribbon topoisomerase 1